MEAAAPMCGILATLVQGLTDYTWYNYRVYLMFWLAAGLSVAFVRYGRAELARIDGLNKNAAPAPNEADMDIPLVKRPAIR